MFTLQIPLLDGRIRLHADLAAATAGAERVAGAVPVEPGTPFQRAWKTIREALRADGIVARMDALVASLLGPDPSAREAATAEPEREEARDLPAAAHQSR